MGRHTFPLRFFSIWVPISEEKGILNKKEKRAQELNLVETHWSRAQAWMDCVHTSLVA
jgi:hypothetical protein